RYRRRAPDPRCFFWPYFAARSARRRALRRARCRRARTLSGALPPRLRSRTGRSPVDRRLALCAGLRGYLTKMKSMIVSRLLKLIAFAGLGLALLAPNLAAAQEIPPEQ